MCGFVGYIQSKGELSAAVATAMADAIAHRGPDDYGVFVDPEARLALAHRRLSIIDLSPEGHQPMTSHSGRYVIVFNGEIYNFAELRAELLPLGYSFRGTSDTEIMLACFERWGIEASLRRFVGMFAFALYDRRERNLTLCRDRFGEKPLYYGWSGGSFFFTSDLAALRVHPDFRREIDRDAAALFVRHCYVPAPYSIYRGIYKLPPATFLTLPCVAGHPPDDFAPFEGRPGLSPRHYWSFRDVAQRGIDNPSPLSLEEHEEELDRLLTHAVSLQMVADVPLGAFLSGGIDSSTTVGVMQKLSSQRVRTFSIGFEEAGFDEAPYAKRVAQHLGTDHTELYLSAAETLKVVPRLPQMFSEPFADSSQIPTFLVSELARRSVTVSLSGDAGDELFGGYPRYLWCDRLWRYIDRFPAPLRRMASAAVVSVSPRAWSAFFNGVAPLLPKSFRLPDPGYRLHRAASMVGVSSQSELYTELLSVGQAPLSYVDGASDRPTIHTQTEQWPRSRDFFQSMMWLDAVSYLPDDILVKVDRAAMACSLETRVPMLDHRVVEFAWRLPTSHRTGAKGTKIVLRRVLERYVPRALIDRPKMGFGIPLEQWLRGPLREWGDDLLSESQLMRHGILNPRRVSKMWSDFQSGGRISYYLLWNFLMMQAWLTHQSPEMGRPQF